MSPEFWPLTALNLEPVIGMMAELYAQGHDPFDPGRARRATAQLISEPQFGGVWTIHLDGSMAGYLALLMGYSLEFGGRFGLLDELFIQAAWRGRGLGSAALAFAARQCADRGWRALRLEVGHENEHALAIYRRAGFVAHDRFLMTKWI